MRRLLHGSTRRRRIGVGAIVVVLLGALVAGVASISGIETVMAVVNPSSTSSASASGTETGASPGGTSTGASGSTGAGTTGTGATGTGAGTTGPGSTTTPGATTTAPGTGTVDPDPDWVGSWATAVDQAGKTGRSSAGFDRQTLRQVTHLSLGGSQVRIRLTNVFGTRDLEVGATTVALRGPGGGATTATKPIPVTWDGASSVTLAPGTERASDPLAMTLPDGADLVISTYLPTKTGPATWSTLSWSTAYLAAGDTTMLARATRYTPTTASAFFLDGVDVYTASGGAVVVLGDSITEGCCAVTSVDANVRYSDVLARRLMVGPPAERMGVLNAGISANRVISGGRGPTALARFERDVLGQTGVRSVILMEGINDIGKAAGALDPADLISVYRQLIARAHGAGITVVGGTLTPFNGSRFFNAGAEQDRQAVNTWIRTSGEFDAVADFDAAVRDPKQPNRMLATFDPGDHLHPNAAGYAAMGAAVPLDALR